MATTAQTKKILFVVTSHDQLGNTGRKTGFWVEEFAAPYYILFDQGYQITIASPKSGQPPIDPSSEQPQFQTEATKRFYNDASLQQQLSQTLKLKDVKADDFDAVVYPGGHGPVWDLSKDTDSFKLIENFAAQKKPVAAVCHGPAVLTGAKDQNGNPLIKDRKVTGFSNSEEEAVQLTKVVPYLLEDKLKEVGGRYSQAGDFQPYVVEDGLLITGQNPASSEGVGLALLKLLSTK